MRVAKNGNLELHCKLCIALLKKANWNQESTSSIEGRRDITLFQKVKIVTVLLLDNIVINTLYYYSHRFTHTIK